MSVDMLIYEGCKLEHWRTLRVNIVVRSLHYNNKKGEFKDINIFDGRDKLGTPKWKHYK